jgi:hypothetical protein
MITLAVLKVTVMVLPERRSMWSIPVPNIASKPALYFPSALEA